MAWYFYKRGGWNIAVNAINQQDAAKHIKIFAPGAEYQGKFNPPSMKNSSTATAMTTARRQVEIKAHLENLLR